MRKNIPAVRLIIMRIALFWISLLCAAITSYCPTKIIAEAMIMDSAGSCVWHKSKLTRKACLFYCPLMVRAFTLIFLVVSLVWWNRWYFIVVIKSESWNVLDCNFFLVHNEPWLYLKIHIDVTVWRFSLNKSRLLIQNGDGLLSTMCNNILKAFLNSPVSFNKNISRGVLFKKNCLKTWWNMHWNWVLSIAEGIHIQLCNSFFCRLEATLWWSLLSSASFVPACVWRLV